MSIRMMTRVWDEAPFDKTVLLVLLALADAANDEGKCWPSISTIARKARCSERWVKQTIVTLEESGWLRVERKRGAGNVYWVTPQEAPSSEVGFTGEETALVKSSSPPVVNPTSLDRGSGVATNHKEPSSEPSLSPSPQEEGEQEQEQEQVSSARQVHPSPRPFPQDWRPNWRPDEHTWDWAVTRIEEPYGVSLVEVAENMLLWAREKGQQPTSALYRTFLVTARDRIIEMENKLDRWEEPKDTRDKWARTYNVAE